MQEVQAYLERVRLIQGRVWIKVKPNASKTGIVNIDDSGFTVQIKAPAEDNKANIELIKFLSKLTKKRVRILSGFSRRLKLVEIA